MGKYRATMSVGPHLFGTVKEYDDSDPVVAHRVKSGMLVRVDGPAPEVPAVEARSKKGPAKKAIKPEVQTEVEAEEPVVELAADPEPDPETVEVPEVAEQDEPAVVPTSSVMTSWTLG